MRDPHHTSLSMITGTVVLLVGLLVGLLVQGCDSASEPASDASLLDSSTAPEAGVDARAADGLEHDIVSTGNIVVTDRGAVEGQLNTASRSFLGIPYAAPPVGSLRWSPPQPHPGWSEVLQASQLGPSCPQIETWYTPLPTSYSEDCLLLNVWTPYPVPADPAPVMVWFHGGGFINGGAALDLYWGQHMAETSGTVLVTVNYRLGPLGFLAHPALGPGNYGILDQQAALEWVQTNIAAFGGDPDNVTIFGESAGSTSVGVHLSIASSQGLFHRAIMQSGALSMFLTDLTQAQAQAQSLAEKLACHSASDVATCLRGKSADEVTGALPLKQGFFFGNGVSWGPVVDNALLKTQPFAAVLSGSFNKVPVLIGTNRDEGTIFLFLAGKLSMTETEYQTLVTSTYGIFAPSVLAQYPTADYASPMAAYADLMGDSSFVCPARASARILAEGGVPAHLYQFTVVPSFNPFAPQLGAYHSAEIPFVFHTAPSFTPDEKALSLEMMGYWTRMAKGGDPNAPDAVTWPPYTAAEDQHLELGLAISVKSGLKKDKCDFWESLVSSP